MQILCTTLLNKVLPIHAFVVYFVIFHVSR